MALIRCLPVLTQNLTIPSQYLVNHYCSKLKMTQLHKLTSNEDQMKLQHFLMIMETLPEAYMGVRIAFKKDYAPDILLDFMMETSTDDNSALPKEFYEQKDLMNKLNQYMIIMKGMMRGYVEFQNDVFQHGLLRRIYEMAGSQNNMRELYRICDDIKLYLQNEKDNLVHPNAHQEIMQLDNSKKQMENEQAQQAMIKVMGNFKMMQIPGLDQLDDQAISCVACKEGYGSDSTQVLGIYLFSTPSEIPEETEWLDNCLNFKKTTPMLTSYTFFNPIHIACHLNALKADVEKSQTEWEGAEIRNNHNSCNNLFPLIGDGAPMDQIEENLLRWYFKATRIKNQNPFSLGWVIMNDFKSLIYKLAKCDPVGGGENNMKAFQFFLGIASYFFEQVDSRDNLNKLQQNVQLILSRKNQSVVPFGTAKLHVELFITNLISSLVVVNYSKWEKETKKRFFEKIVLFMETQKESTDVFKDSFAMAKPLLISLVIVNEIFNQIHSRCAKKEEMKPIEIVRDIQLYVQQNSADNIEQFPEIYQNYKKVNESTSLIELAQHLGISYPGKSNEELFKELCEKELLQI